MSSDVAEVTRVTSVAPDGWTSPELGSLFAASVPGHWGDDPIDDGNILVLRSTNFKKAGGLDYSTAAPRQFDERKLAQKRLAPGDIILERSGGSPAQPVGRPRRFDREGLYSASNFMQILKPSCQTDSVFVCYLLDNIYAQGLTERLQKATTGIRNLDFKAYLELPILLPALDEQRRIAEVLRSLDEAIEAAQNAHAASQAVHRLALEALFGVCFSEAHADGERISTIREVCERVTYGFTNPMPTTDEGPWMLTAANVRHGWIDYNSARHTSIAAYTNDISDKSRPPVGAVLVTKDGTLGRVARVDRADVCVNQSVSVLIPNPSAVDGAFLSYLLQCPTGQDRMLADSGGSSVKHIYISKLAELPFKLPPPDVQKERATFAEESERAVHDQTRAVDGLLALKSHVMSELLSGRVRVPA